MPRNGSGVYSHPFPDVVEGTTVESTVFNGNTSDVEQDLNTPRPIVAGGTGANNAHDAMVALSGEITSQAVTNYNSHPFVAGSFQSDAGATGAPNGTDSFVGHCYSYNNSLVWMVLEARSLTDASNPGLKYVRQNRSGTWGAWAVQPGSSADLDARYVNTTGDAMTGALAVTDATTAALKANGWDETGANPIAGALWLGNTPAYQGRIRYDPSTATGQLFIDNTQVNVNSGIYLRTQTGGGSPKSIVMTGDGSLSVNNGNVIAGGHFMSIQTTATGTYYFGNSGTKYLNYDGTNFNLVGGPLSALSKGHTFGSASGAGATTGVPITDANIILYNAGPTNWAGIGIDTGGNMWFKTGLSGAPVPAMQINNAQNVQFTGSVNAGYLSGTGTYYFGNSGTKYLNYDGTNFNFVGGAVQAVDVHAQAGSLISDHSLYLGYTSGTSVGTIYWGSSGTKYLNYDGTNFNLVGGDYLNTNSITATGSVQATLGLISNTNLTISYSTATGGSIYFGNSLGKSLRYDGTNFQFTGGNLYVNGALVTVSSDYRIKKDVIDLPGMWDTVKALRPIKYTQAEFSTPSYIAEMAKAKIENAKNGTKENTLYAPMYAADDVERWGFIAHELQATLTPSVASGVKDAPDEIQAPNPFALIAALTKALQEAMARIEAIEAAP